MHKRYANYHFIGQRDDEEILLIIHRHWFNILVHFLGLIFAGLVLVFGSFSLFWFSIDITTLINSQLVDFLVNTLILFIWLFFFFLWIDVWFDVWIVTNRRIINIEQKGMFVREISELQIDKIQDVTSEVIGVIPSILNFGNVSVQTAGEQEHFEFYQVPDPTGIKNMISHIIHAKEDNESIEQAINETTFENTIR